MGKSILRMGWAGVPTQVSRFSASLCVPYMHTEHGLVGWGVGEKGKYRRTDGQLLCEARRFAFYVVIGGVGMSVGVDVGGLPLPSYV